MRKIEDTHEVQKLENLKKVLSSKKLNLSALSRLAGDEINVHIIQDWKRGKGLLSPSQAVLLKTAINTLRIKLKAVFTEFDKNPKSEAGIKMFKELFKKDDFFWLLFFDRDMVFYRKIQAWELGRRVFPIEDLQKLKSFILIFLTETVI